MPDFLQASYPLRASLAAIGALGAIAVIFGGVYGLIRLATPKGRRGQRPDPFQGPQELVGRRPSDEERS